jgi:hypothetical protein
MMKFSQFVAVVATALCASLFASSANAQATRTWVSGVGDDVNPCSRTAPCKTFAGAISKTAAGGEIDCLDPGGFGTLTITKSITVDCTGTFGSVLSSGGVSGFTLNDSATATPGSIAVTIRGVSIDGAGSTPGLHGIRVLSAGSLTVENVRAFGFSGNGILVAPTAASGNTFKMVVKNSTIYNAASGAVLVKPAAGISVAGAITDSSLHASLFGIRVEDRTTVSIADTSLSNNTNSGVAAFSTAVGAQVNATRILVANNGTGLGTTGANAAIRISYSSLFANGIGISAPSGNVISTNPATNATFGNVTPSVPTTTVPLQ